MKNTHILGMVGLGMATWAALAQPVLAKTATAECYGENGTMIVCEEGFSDGSSPANIPVSVIGMDGKKTPEGTLDKRGEISFAKPISRNYTISFGDGTMVKSSDVHMLRYYND